MFSYFAYVAAFVDDGGDADVQGPLVAVGAAIAPFVFIVLGLVSKNPLAPKHILWAMLLLIGVGLTVGLLDPALGAAAGFGAGGAVTLNRPKVDKVRAWRIGAVVFTIAYCLLLLVAVPAAGVFTGGVMPLVMIGFADEYAIWAATRA